jgi:hypothetical protein
VRRSPKSSESWPLAYQRQAMPLEFVRSVANREGLLWRLALFSDWELVHWSCLAASDWFLPFYAFPKNVAVSDPSGSFVVRGYRVRYLHGSGVLIESREGEMGESY